MSPEQVIMWINHQRWSHVPATVGVPKRASLEAYRMPSPHADALREHSMTATAL
jgi:hypothetical protein